MIGKRCSLCGGKIVHGRCEDCGLDATKNDSHYKLNRSYCDQKPLTHTHNHPVINESGSKKQNKMKSQWQQLENTSRNREIVKESKAKSKRGIIIMVIVLVISVISEGVGPFVNFVENTVSQITGGLSGVSSDLSNQSYDESGEYQYVTRELAAEGELCELILTAGFYEIGVEIPEGTYSFSVDSGMGQMALRDKENNIYLYESMSLDPAYEDERTECEDVRMYAGAWLEVTDNLRLKITSENAQKSSTKEMITNPNTNEIILDGTGGNDTAQTGTKVPAGVYDITITEGYGSLEFYIPDHTYTDEDTKEEYSTDSIYLDADGEYGAKMYHNVSIPEGTKLQFIDLKLKLNPTPMISQSEYMSMWNVID